MLKNLPQNLLKLLQKEQFQKTVDATANLIGNKIADAVAKL